ncbi:MAG: hypothetical protein ACFE96_12535 [Candidatus Hermodarchaeota archaeon]
MEKLKIKRIVLVVLVISVFLSLIPAATAFGGRKNATKRPIEDWLVANNLVDDMPMGGMEDWDKSLLIWPHMIDPSYAPYGYYLPPLECDYDGFIMEKKRKDNILSVTVNLRVKDAPFFITTWQPGGIPNHTPIFTGTMDYIYQLRFTIDLDEYEFFDEDGNVVYLAWWWYVWEFFTLESVFLCGIGSGEFVNDFGSYEAGDTASMHTIHYMKVIEDYTGPNPKYNLYGLNGLILIDNINFH